MPAKESLDRQVRNLPACPTIFPKRLSDQLKRKRPRLGPHLSLPLKEEAWSLKILTRPLESSAIGSRIHNTHTLSVRASRI